MTRLRSAFFPFMLIVSTAALAGGPMIQPNEHYEKVGREQAQKDIKACMKTARSLDAPGRQDSGMSVGGFPAGRGGSGDADPMYQNTVERCLSNKGYKVVGWN